MPRRDTGTVVADRYVLGAVLGRGGMGEVRRAHDRRLDRDVAVKLLDSPARQVPEALARFEYEARAAAALTHPNVVRVYDYGDDGDCVYLVMEALSGRTLGDEIARGPVAPHRLVEVACDVLAGLAAAHARGIVHRDIKPGNVMVADDGHVKVLDFGLARQFRMPGGDQAGLEGSTILGRPLGTANYMAPERVLQGPLDPRSDLFSLGVVMYEMATGRLPFAGASPAETVTNILEQQPVPVTKLSPARSMHLQKIVMRLLTKDPDGRYQTARELQEALGAPASKRTLRKLLRP